MTDPEGTDLYVVLGVTPDATPTELRLAHRRAAREAHPDTGGGSVEAMALVNRAWACLGDPAHRAVYDRSREELPRQHLDPDRGAECDEDSAPAGDGHSRRLLQLLVLAVAVLLVAGLVLALLIGFTQGPGVSG